MEATLYRALYRFVRSVAHPRRPRVQFPDRAIVLVYLWSVLHDRPVTWACDRRNWPGGEPPFELPSDTTMSRRLVTVGVVQLIERVLRAASDLVGPPPLVKVVDSKPMTVGAYSKDRDAKRGRVGAGQMARGSRLHALTHGRAVRHWTLGPMNDHDSVHAPTLLARLEGGGGYVVADNAYDANALHAVAAGAGHQLVAPPREAERHVRDGRYNTPHRLRALDIVASPTEFCRGGRRAAFGVALYNHRETVESCFGELSMAGLNYLPAWVRGPRRVALWAAGKILLQTIRCARRQGLMA
jgi:hypothetical protein